MVKPSQGTCPTRKSSTFKGVTKHKLTGKFEAHLWDKEATKSNSNKKGRQVYLGAFDDEEVAAHCYDLATLKYFGPEAKLNFSITTYSKEYDEMQNMSKEEYLANLRRQSSGFSRGVSQYRGVARHQRNGRWEARIGSALGKRYAYLGSFNSEEEAAIAYDLALVQHKGINAMTNFDINNYVSTSSLSSPPSPLEQERVLAAQQPLTFPKPPPFEQFCNFDELLEDISLPVVHDFISPINDDDLWYPNTETKFDLLPNPDSSMAISSELSEVLNGKDFGDDIEKFFGENDKYNGKEKENEKGKGKI